jgi:Autographiviridae RNA polymerase
MDTNVLPDETNVPNELLGQSHERELLKASEKFEKRDDRNEAYVGFGATTEGMVITTTYLNHLTEAVREKLSSGERPKSNTLDFKLERLLRQLGHDVLALCILQSGLHSAGRDACGYAAAGTNMGQAINDELWAAELLQSDKKLHARISKQAKERFASVDLRKSYAKRLAEEDGFTMKDWSEKLLLRAGNWGLDLLVNAMPLVFERREPKGYRGEYLWSVTELGLDMAKEALSEVVCRSPVYQPRTERPKDWDRFTMNVAEDDRTLDRAQLLRTSHKDIISATNHAIRTGTMGTALRAINALQSVPFTVNTWIRDVIIECYNRGITVDGLPSRGKLEVPKKLPAEEFAQLSIEQRRLLAKTRRGKLKANRTNDADDIMFREDMETVDLRLITADQFFCPMNMDWRGRVYSLTSFAFAREDRVRALFLCANGEPIGRKGIYWLAMHVANCGAFKVKDADGNEAGIDKKPIRERVRWVKENLTLIKDYVKRPLYNTGWTKADSPFLFLAAARELVSALQTGPGYVCHMPVSFDGSCSGLQHLAAMTLAPEGSYVNLTNNASPEDVYQRVASRVQEMIRADFGNEELFGKADEEKPERKTVMTFNKLAKLVDAYGIDRKLVKRNVMVFCYASNEYGMSEQQFEDTMAPLEMKWLKGEIENHPFGDTDDEWRLVSRYIAKRTLAAIKEIVRLPAEAMAFMQAIAKAMAHEGKPVRWTSPAGVPCINRYHDVIKERVELFFQNNGVKRKVKIEVATGYDTPIAKAKSASTIAPNFVHSHDAGHLLMTVDACVSEGITDIATVHDSFGCLPSRATRFNQIIREQFLKMYSEHDVLAELLESARADLTPANHHRLPELPAKGALNLKEVLNAKYAFA